MHIKVATGDITEQQVGAIIVNLFEDVTAPKGATGAVDAALDGAISRLISDGEIKGKRGELTLIHTLGKIPPARVLVAGLGKGPEISADAVRSIAAESCRRLRRTGVETVATIIHGAGAGGLAARTSGRTIAEGSVMGLYRFNRHKSGDDDRREIRELTLIEFDAGKLEEIEWGVREGEIIADAVNLCRDMVNEPANHMTPTRMAELGMGAILGVAQGADEPAKFIILRHKGDDTDDTVDLGLLGKGITFDSGGLDIKQAANMRHMKGDMGGGAAVIAAMKGIGRLKLKLNVTAMVPATENMPGGRAQRPGDVKTMSGKTVEIDNTDAEGWLVLADATTYAKSQGVERLVDVATLTGAVNVALGNLCTGAFGNDQSFTDRVVAAGNRIGERTWQLPIYDEYKEHYRSDVADIKNTGGRGAGAITAAMFIGEFAGDCPWVHLDIAGTNVADKHRGHITKGATGVPVRTLVELARELSTD